LREFDGWTPQAETVHEHDDQGRLIRSATITEPAWDELQRGWMLALRIWESRRCPVCGGNPDDCQSPDADRNNPHATWIYQPDLPVECHVGTAARIGAAKPDERRALIPQVRKRRRGQPLARR